MKSINATLTAMNDLYTKLTCLQSEIISGQKKDRRDPYFILINSFTSWPVMVHINKPFTSWPVMINLSYAPILQTWQWRQDGLEDLLRWMHQARCCPTQLLAEGEVTFQNYLKNRNVTASCKDWEVGTINNLHNLYLFTIFKKPVQVFSKSLQCSHWQRSPFSGSFVF